MKQLLIIIIISLLSIPVFSENTPWEQNLATGLTLSQASFSNWAAGGENSLSWQFNIDGTFNKNMNQDTWTNSLKLIYGETKQGSSSAKKSADELRAESTYIFNKKTNYVSVVFLSQLAKGIDYSSSSAQTVSYFFDPAYFTESMGFEFETTQTIITRLGLALKQTLVNKSTLTTTQSEAGGEFVAKYSDTLFDNLLASSTLQLFSKFTLIKEIDLYWDNSFSQKLSNNINWVLGINLIYNRDVSSKIQVRQTFGLQYNFNLI